MISNIVVVGRDNPRLVIPDQTIFRLRGDYYGSGLDAQTVRMIIYLGFGANRQVVSYFFGRDITE